MVPAMKKVTGVLSVFLKYVMIALFVYMVVGISIEVFARYLFHKSFVWTEEPARYCMIWMIFIGSTEIAFNSEHIKVSIVEDFARGIGKKAVNAIQYIISIVFAVLLFRFSIPAVALASKAISSNTTLNMGLVYGFFPVISLLMVVAYLFKLILLFADKAPRLPAQSEEKGEQQA